MNHVDVTTLQQLVEDGYLTCRPHPTADLVIYNYTSRCQFEHYWTPETLMCRGLITKNDGTIVARSFPKFFNIEEHQGPIPLEPFKVTEKMDGSLGILYFAEGEPFIATRGSFTSEQALRATKILYTRYKEVIPMLKEYSYHTLLFEIIFPENRIVIDYGAMEDLVLLTIIHTETGEEEDIHRVEMWPFPVVKHYDGITDIAALRELEKDNQEGFVLHFESGLRLKLKFAEYVRLHRLITQVNARVIWDLLRNNQPFDELLNRVPDEFYAWVASTRDSLVAKYRDIEDGARRLYAQVKDIPTRKEQAEIVKLSPYAAVTFRMLDNKNYDESVWKQLRPVAERPFREDIDV